MKNNAIGLTGMSKAPYNTSGNRHFPEVPTPPPTQIGANCPIIPPTEVPHELIELAEQAQSYFDSYLADSTLHAYEHDWVGFQQWCNTYGVRALPAEISTVALYISSLAERTLTVSTIKRHLAAIKAKHMKAGYPSPSLSPVIKGIIHGIARRLGAPARGAEAILPETLKRMIRLIDEKTLIGRRDRALLLIGFAGAFRRSELVGMNVDDIEWHNEGAVILLRRSKTDQQGQGRLVGIPHGRKPETCPVMALKVWITSAGITEGAIFRGMDCHDRIVSERLSGRAVSMVVKRHAKTIGLNIIRYSGHSLRAGHCTAAARAGAAEKLIMAQTGHHSHSTLLKYIRLGSLFRENSARSIIL